MVPTQWCAEVHRNAAIMVVLRYYWWEQLAIDRLKQILIISVSMCNRIMGAQANTALMLGILTGDKNLGLDEHGRPSYAWLTGNFSGKLYDAHFMP